MCTVSPATVKKHCKYRYQIFEMIIAPNNKPNLHYTVMYIFRKKALKNRTQYTVIQKKTKRLSLIFQLSVISDCRVRARTLMAHQVQLVETILYKYSLTRKLLIISQTYIKGSTLTSHKNDCQHLFHRQAQFHI